jgi:NAD(P)-dependent dehydrogenase (short-subunit alcohol dehydrogenase family)
VALITGAASGIGAATALSFVEAGAAVALLDRDEVGLRDVACDVDEAGGRASTWTADVTDEKAVASSIAGAVKVHGQVDHVVNAAGILASSSVAETSLQNWKEILEINLTGAFLVAREAVRAMLANGTEGSITFVSSQAGKRGGSFGAAYCASKFGVLGLMQSLAIEIAGRGIRVNAVCPGDVSTPMTESNVRARARLLGVSADEYAHRMVAGIPLGRLASAQEIASVLLFLASPAASYISGESINIDGAQLSG